MSAPVHFDVDKIIAQHRVLMQETTREALAAAPTEADRRYVLLQDGLNEVGLAVGRWHLEAHNAGEDDQIVREALAAQLANIMVTFGCNSRGGKIDGTSALLATLGHFLSEICGDAPPRDTIRKQGKYGGIMGGTA